MQLNEFYKYKNELMMNLCTNEAIVKLVTENDEADVPSHTLPYTQFYPYQFVPETVSEAKTFICFDVDITSAPSRTFYLPVVYVWIFTHKSKFRTNHGTILLDELSSEVDQMLNGSRYYGLGELKLDSVTRFVPIADYLGRALVYTARDFNRPYNPKPIPSKR